MNWTPGIFWLVVVATCILASLLEQPRKPRFKAVYGEAEPSPYFTRCQCVISDVAGSNPGGDADPDCKLCGGVGAIPKVPA